MGLWIILQGIMAPSLDAQMEILAYLLYARNLINSLIFIVGRGQSSQLIPCLSRPREMVSQILHIQLPFDILFQESKLFVI